VSLARTILSIAECAYERNDPKGAHFGCPKERGKVRELATKGLMAITTEGKGELYARITNPGLTALDKLRQPVLKAQSVLAADYSAHLSREIARKRAVPLDPSGNPSQPSPSGVSYTHPADWIDEG
jgi:hypothetical protein